MSWAQSIQSQLLQRDERESTHRTLIAHSQKLAQRAAMLSARNRNLLNASSSGGSGKGSYLTATASSNSGGGAAASTSGGDAAKGSSSGAGHDSVRLVMIASLEAQLAQTRGELAEQYKVQSTNAQRLLALTDQLRDVEDRGREERDELGKIRMEAEGLRERSRWHKEVVQEKEKQLIILQDDLAALELELNQVTQQNENLKIDNAALLQRWIEAKNEEARRMNELFQVESTRARGMSSPPIGESTDSTKSGIKSSAQESPTIQSAETTLPREVTVTDENGEVSTVT